MLGMGMGEMILVAGIALIIIGPERFPEFAKICMRTIRDLRSYVEEAKDDLRKELTPIKKEIDKVKNYDPESYIDALTDSRDDSGYYKASHEQKTGESAGGSTSTQTKSGATEPESRSSGEKPEADSAPAKDAADTQAGASKPESPSAPASPGEEDVEIPKPMDG
ncbi:MAG TPA: twin-arginine translocase TatA/TatE family subunit [Candidatus Hydrogenedentes bacterium]|nr:twin-arginine translocase TatA/TatE family subunit [Candidatus Hydrogenedentota bacterium]HQM51094.1 twin-arginine translocase TatA/TatE family subunit [Candidatus Hydrogenedentota bacterium]